METLAARILNRLTRRSEFAGPAEDREREAGSADARVWQVMLAGGLLLALLYVVMPYGLVAAGLYAAISFGAAVLLVAAVHHRTGLCFAAAWILLAGGLALTAVGHVIWFWFDFRGVEPFLSIADAFYLAAYPLYIAAIWKLGRDGTQGSGALIDALFVGVAAAVLGWTLLIAPYFDAALGTWYKVVASAYPVMDLILLPLVLRLMFQHGTGIPVYRLLLAGMLFYLLADVLYAHGNIAGWYAAGGFTDAWWLVAYSLLVAAVWHPSATEPRSYVADAGLSKRRLVLLAAAAVLVPAVTLGFAGEDVQIVWVGAVGSILLFLLVLLVLLRMGGLLSRVHRQSEKLEELVRTDPLTGAANRRRLEEELPRELARADRARTSLCLVFLDIDHFKPYNDTYGHAAGDDLLRELVAAWSGALRAPDILSRFGGEEFVVVLPGTDSARARTVAERLRALVPHGQTCSAGVACYQFGESIDSLVGRADEAMYRAKHEGRDRTVVAD